MFAFLGCSGRLETWPRHASTVTPSCVTKKNPRSDLATFLHRRQELCLNVTGSEQRWRPWWNQVVFGLIQVGAATSYKYLGGGHVCIIYELILNVKKSLMSGNNVWCNKNRTKHSSVLLLYYLWFDFYCIRRYHAGAVECLKIWGCTLHILIEGPLKKQVLLGAK